MIIIGMNVSIYILFVCAGMIFKKVVNVATFELKMSDLVSSHNMH